MRCFEQSLAKFLGLHEDDIPDFDGEDWAAEVEVYMRDRGYLSFFMPVDGQAIVSEYLPNGKLHSELKPVGMVVSFRRIQ
jgi:hypothetical protein